MLVESRQLIAEARELLDTESRQSGGVDPAPGARGGAGVLSLYEQLRSGLERIDDGRLRQLLARLSTNVEQLRQLDVDVDQLRGLRRAIEEL